MTRIRFLGEEGTMYKKSLLFKVQVPFSGEELLVSKWQLQWAANSPHWKWTYVTR